MDPHAWGLDVGGLALMRQPLLRLTELLPESLHRLCGFLDALTPPAGVPLELRRVGSR